MFDAACCVGFGFDVNAGFAIGFVRALWLVLWLLVLWLVLVLP
jgi:tetrahydromethanopterin S-methyltransferase subunit F